MADLQISTLHCTEFNSSSPSTSTVATTSNYPYYGVFINHRGPDTKKTFASHMYYRLLSHGLQPFLDREELEAGEHLAPQIEGAIRTASIHIAIFSPKYAESHWCLEELVRILKSGSTVIPIFFNVKPSELRSTEGPYAQALAIHEQKRKYHPQTLGSWRKALCDVSSLSGFELETCNGDEGMLLDKVVKCVLKRRETTALNVAAYPTGLEEKVQEFEKKMEEKIEEFEKKAQVFGIVGLGGIGKTTLAKELFNRKTSDFGISCFLMDVRENAGRRSLNSLQAKLIKDLVQTDVQIHSVDEGIVKLRTYLSSSHHALVVLDDVDNLDHLYAFLPIKDVLSSGSLILVTSRDKDILTKSGIAESSIYKLTGLNPQHSQQLFCSYAFSQPHPSPGFKDLVDEFVRACDGLPLSLKMFGALLCGKNDRSYWEGQLGKLRQTKLPDEILNRFKISYDALDVEEKQIFLDIACYFIGEDRDMAIRVWDGSGWKGLVGFLNIESKCLVEVDRENRIKIHDHLRDLGRTIADQERSLGIMPHRLWQRIGSIRDLCQQSSVTTELRGIKTVPQVSGLESRRNEVFRKSLSKLIHTPPYSLRKLQLVAAEGDLLESILRRVKSPDLIWLRWKKCPCSFLPSWIPMKNIRVLEVVGNKLERLWRYQAPLELRELNISAPLLKFPKSIGQLKHIEKIVLNYPPILVHLKTLPKEFCRLSSLKYLHLRCSHMESLPESFGNLTNLQHLDLSYSASLHMLPKSFGNLIRLRYLCLKSCYNLIISNESFGHIKSLEYLNLSSCRKMEVLPPQVASQGPLEEMCLSETCLKQMPSDIGQLSNLEVLSLESPWLEMLPSSLGHLGRLKQLYLYGCIRLKCLPDSLGLLTQLSTLSISGCAIHSLPPEVSKMSNLVIFRVEGCPLLELPFGNLVEGERETLSDDPKGKREFSKLETSVDKGEQQCMPLLEYLELDRTEISRICFPEGVCPNLKHLDIKFCNDLTEVGALPLTLITLKLIDCSQLNKIQGLSNLTKLQELNINNCKEVEELPSLERLIFLEKFVALGCSKLRRIQGLELLIKLRLLDVEGCDVLEEMAGIEELKLLGKIHVQFPKGRWEITVAADQ